MDIYDRRTKRMAAVPSADEADGDVDMENFMVLDSVGSGDGQSLTNVNLLKYIQILFSNQ